MSCELLIKNYKVIKNEAFVNELLTIRFLFSTNFFRNFQGFMTYKAFTLMQ